MTRRALVLVALTAVVLAGCSGGPGTGTETTIESTENNGTATVSSGDIPGVSNGTLTNATALARANEASLAETGGTVQIRRSSSSGQATATLALGAGFTTYSLTSSESGRDDAVDASIWSNETTRVIRTAYEGEYTYRTADRRVDRLNILTEVTDYLAAVNFTVANGSTDNGTVVFTADTVGMPGDSHGPSTNGNSLDGRLVVSESGLIQALSVSTSSEQKTGSYSYELRQTGVDRVAKPDWFDDVPAGATLQTQLSVGVENSSYLVVRSEGGDHVPSNTSISVTSNNTTVTATLDTSLMAGDSRYAYVDATTGTLHVTEDRPTAGAVDPLTSPTSVSITTDDGASLYSTGMAWQSESASAPETESAGESNSGGTSVGRSTSSGGASGTGNSYTVGYEQ